MYATTGLVVLLATLFQVSQAQYVMTTYYESQECSGQSMSYQFQPLNVCINMGGIVVESNLFKQDNETTYTQYTFTTPDCSGGPAIIQDFTLDVCVEWGGENGTYYSGSYQIMDSPVVPSLDGPAYQVSLYPSCEDTSIILQRFIFNPSYCYSEAPGTSWKYDTCNATTVTKDEFTDTTTCSGGSMQQEVTTYDGCKSLPFHMVQECYLPNATLFV